MVAGVQQAAGAEEGTVSAVRMAVRMDYMSSMDRGVTEEQVTIGME